MNHVYLHQKTRSTKATARTVSTTKLSQDQSKGSASGQEARGRLDKAPKPFQATYSFWNFAIVHFSRIQVCARHQELESHRKTHKSLVLRDYIAESGLSWNQAVVYLCFVADIWSLFLDFSSATHERFLPLAHGDIHLSRSTFGFDLGGWGILFRSFYRYAQSLGLVYLPTSKPPRISESKNHHLSLETGEVFHTPYIVLYLT